MRCNGRVHRATLRPSTIIIARHVVTAILGCVLLALCGHEAFAGDAAPLPKLMVLDIELTGDLGGPEFVAEHEARLRNQSAHLREALRNGRRFDVLDNAPVTADLDALKAQQMYLHECNGCDLDVGRRLHADRVLAPWVTRVSGLILTLTYEMHDVETGQILERQSFDFRGDNDAAWTHAVDYMIRHMPD
jgi:hypothetical protein